MRSRSFSLNVTLVDLRWFVCIAIAFMGLDYMSHYLRWAQEFICYAIVEYIQDHCPEIPFSSSKKLTPNSTPQKRLWDLTCGINKQTPSSTPAYPHQALSPGRLLWGMSIPYLAICCAPYLDPWNPCPYGADLLSFPNPIARGSIKCRLPLPKVSVVHRTHLLEMCQR